MTYPTEARHQELNAMAADAGEPAGWAVRIIAAEDGGELSAVPLADTRLPSLDTPHVLDWLAMHRDSAFFVLPEPREESSAPPLAQTENNSSLVVAVELQEYESVVGLLPGRS